MALTADPDVQEDIDLTWVTFAEEDPTVPCRFVGCDKDASYTCICLPCLHEYPFCNEHVMYTKMTISMYQKLLCTDCMEIIHDVKWEPIKRG